jgi:protein-disulfide isomerase
LLYGGLYAAARKAESIGSVFNIGKILAAYDSAPVIKIPVDADDPVTGNADAPIRIITFSDFQCKSCQSFSFVLRRMNEKFPGKLQVVFKYFPLGMACNNTMSEDLHPRACEAAWAAEAARQQGKFWEFHNFIFRFDLNTGDRTLCSFADSVGLNHAQFETYRTSKAAMDKIARTVEQAKKIGVDGTPAIFVNGKEITDFRPIAFEPLLKHILENPKLQRN